MVEPKSTSLFVQRSDQTGLLEPAAERCFYSVFKQAIVLSQWSSQLVAQTRVPLGVVGERNCSHGEDCECVDERQSQPHVSA